MLPTDEFGHFSLRLTEPGNYTLSTSCNQPCAPHGISATYSGDANFGGSSGGTGSGPAPIIAILVGLLLPAAQNSANTPVAASFNVDKRGLVVSGQLPSTEGTYFIGTANGGTWKTLADIKLQDFGILRGQISRSTGVFVAAGDINGDGRAETIVTPYSTGGQGDSRSAQVDMFLKLKAPAPANANAKPAATPGTFGEPVTFTANVAPSSPGAGTPTGSVTFHNAEGLRISENESPRPTNRTITVTPVNDAPGISDQGAAMDLTSYGTAPGPTTGGDGKAPGIRGRLINNSERDPMVSGNVAGSNRDHIDQDAQIETRSQAAGPRLESVGSSLKNLDIALASESGGHKFTAKTDEKGAFNFTKLPAGKYTIFTSGSTPQPARLVTIGADGTFSGNLARSAGGEIDIISWSFATVSSSGATVAAETVIPNTVKNPVSGFGSGNTSGFGSFGGGPGTGMRPGGPVGPASPMGGAGGPGGPMGGGAMKR